MIGILRTTGLVGAAALLAATPTLADNTPEQNKVLYELQEKCGKDAAAFVKSMPTIFDGGKNLFGHGSYEAHYNAHTNACYVHIYALTETEAQWSVWDVNAHRQVASLTDPNSGPVGRTACWVLDPQSNQAISCLPEHGGYDDLRSSVGKWETLVKPYMESAAPRF